MQGIGHAREIRAKRDRAAFKALIATPAVGAFTMPAGGRLRLVSVAGCAADTTSATFASTTLKTPVLGAGEWGNAVYLAKNVQLTPATGFEAHLDMGLGKFVKIAEGA